MRDRELRRLKEAERLAYERFMRLSANLAEDPELIRDAERLWLAAATAVRNYELR